MSEITTIELKISRVITEEGTMVVRFSIPREFNSVEVLGLLEAAKLHVYNQMP